MNRKPLPMAAPEILSLYPSAKLMRRLAALFYDCILLMAVFFIATIPAIAFNKGNAVNHYYLYQLYILFVWFIFYAWFWTHKGQTLGMAAWKIHLVNHQGTHISWQQAGIRFFTAALGLGNLIIPFNKLGLGWQDMASKTILIYKQT